MLKQKNYSYIWLFLSVIAVVGFSFHLEEVMRWIMNNPLPNKE